MKKQENGKRRVKKVEEGKDPESVRAKREKRE